MKLTTLAIAGAAFALFGAASTASAEVIRYAEFGPNRGTRAEALTWFADEINSRTGGEVEIEFHWGKSLLGTSAVLQGLSDGVADMGSVIGFFTPSELRGYNIGDLPVDNSDEWVGMRALYDLATTNEAMAQEFANNGVTYITNYTTGPIQLICTEPVDSLADLDGTAVRGSGPYGKTLGDYGADVQRMSQGDVYQSLESGLIECNQNYYYSMVAYRQYEVAQHVTELNWGQNMSFGIFMNDDAWDRLSAEHQAVIRDVGSEFIDVFAQMMIEGRESNRAAMVEGIDGNAVTIHQLPDAERAQLIETGGQYIDAWVSEAEAESVDGAGLLAEYQAHIDRYAGELSSSGYPWSR